MFSYLLFHSVIRFFSKAWQNRNFYFVFPSHCTINLRLHTLVSLTEHCTVYDDAAQNLSVCKNLSSIVRDNPSKNLLNLPKIHAPYMLQMRTLKEKVFQICRSNFTERTDWRNLRFVIFQWFDSNTLEPVSILTIIIFQATTDR